MTKDTNNSQSKDFIVKDFIEGLTETSRAINRRSGAANNGGFCRTSVSPIARTNVVPIIAFDPKPYIRTFEAALERLKELDETLSEKESELKEGVRRAEIDHSRTLERLGLKFNSTLSEFQRLDSSISDGGGMAVRIGGQLEQLDKQRQRAEDAKFLIQCYTEFSRGDMGRLENLRRTGRIEDSIRCAVVGRQLSLIVKRTEGPGTNARTKELIESFSETLEQDLLKQFDDAYRRFNVEAMKVGLFPSQATQKAARTDDCVRGAQKYFMISMAGRLSLAISSIKWISSLRLARLMQGRLLLKVQCEKLFL